MQIKKPNIFLIILMSQKKNQIRYMAHMYILMIQKYLIIYLLPLPFSCLYLSILRVEQMLNARDNHFFDKKFFLKWIIYDKNKKKLNRGREFEEIPLVIKTLKSVSVFCGVFTLRLPIRWRTSKEDRQL